MHTLQNNVYTTVHMYTVYYVHVYNVYVYINYFIVYIRRYVYIPYLCIQMSRKKPSVHCTSEMLTYTKCIHKINYVWTNCALYILHSMYTLLWLAVYFGLYCVYNAIHIQCYVYNATVYRPNNTMYTPCI
jgi:hypothetical protein